MRSARAEEGILRLLFADNTLFESIAGRLTAARFSAPVLGKIFSEAQRLYQSGHLVTAASFEGVLTDGEMRHLSQVLSKPETTAQRQQALDDYIKTITDCACRRGQTGADGQDPMLAYAASKRNK
jgi:DNA primase